MFAIPQMMTIPAMTSGAGMTLDWPTIGAFLAWTLIAAFVGIGLGALHRLTTPAPSVTHLLPGDGAVNRHVYVDHHHLEAA
jgi:hypothetical protein